MKMYVKVTFQLDELYKCRLCLSFIIKPTVSLSSNHESVQSQKECQSPAC